VLEGFHSLIDHAILRQRNGERTHMDLPPELQLPDPPADKRKTAGGRRPLPPELMPPDPATVSRMAANTSRGQSPLPPGPQAPEVPSELRLPGSPRSSLPPGLQAPDPPELPRLADPPRLPRLPDPPQDHESWFSRFKDIPGDIVAVFEQRLDEFRKLEREGEERNSPKPGTLTNPLTAAHASQGRLAECLHLAGGAIGAGRDVAVSAPEGAIPIIACAAARRTLPAGAACC
jgi:hypothetical protein